MRVIIYKGEKGNFLVMNMFIILFVVLISQVYVDDKTNRIVHFKDGQFIVCQLSLHSAM